MSIINRILSVIMVICLAITTSGCSFFVGSTQKFSVNSTEPDSQIFINGSLIGNGSVQTMVRRDQSVSVMVKKDGYYPSSRDIGTKMSSTAILDIIGGCFFLIPFIGLAAPGAHDLDQDSVSIVLQKAQ